MMPSRRSLKKPNELENINPTQRYEYEQYHRERAGRSIVKPTIIVTGSDEEVKLAKAATTANITLSGAQTIDGVSCVAEDNVLVKNQSTASQNGYYVVKSGAWTRVSQPNVVCVKSGGTQNGKLTFILDSTNTYAALGAVYF